LRFIERLPSSGLKPVSLAFIGITVFLALFILSAGDASGDPPATGNWYIDGQESYADTTLTVNGSLQINSTGELSLSNVTLIINNTIDREYTIKVYGSFNVNSSTIKAFDSGKRMGDSIINGSMSCTDSFIMDFADFTLSEGADFMAENTDFSDGRRLFVVDSGVSSVMVLNSTFSSTGNDSSIQVNDMVYFRDVTFHQNETELGANGTLFVQHFLSIYVNDTDGDPVEDANARIVSSGSDENHTTPTNGWIYFLPLTEYWMDVNGTVVQENYTITVTKVDSEVTVQMKLNESMTRMVTLNLLPDPYVEEDDITVPAKPNEKDIVPINVTVHANGGDAEVIVTIYLKDTKGKLTELANESMTLKRGITSYLNTTWNSTKMKRGSYAVVVEIENITEDGDLDNNMAEKGFSLYVRPIVENMTVNTTDVHRLELVGFKVSGTDWETTDPADFTLEAEAKASLLTIWEAGDFSAPYWDGNDWIVNFTPPSDAKIGYWDFRARFTDDNNGVSEWYYRYTDVFVRNNEPMIDGIIPNYVAEEDQNITINLSAYEKDMEDNGTELNWYVMNGYDMDAIKMITGENSTDDLITFVPETNFTGNISITLILTDKDGGEDSQLIYLNWTSVNDLPVLEDLSFTATTVYRDQHLTIVINASDDLTDEDDLILSLQLLHEDAVNWTTENFTIVYQYKDGSWHIDITPFTMADLGMYSIRFNITDTFQPIPANSSYYYYNSSIEVLNNPPSTTYLTPDMFVVMRTNTIVFTFNGTDVEE